MQYELNYHYYYSSYLGLDIWTNPEAYVFNFFETHTTHSMFWEVFWYSLSNSLAVWLKVGMKCSFLSFFRFLLHLNVGYITIWNKKSSTTSIFNQV